MNTNDAVRAAREASMPRRDFLRRSLMLALPAAFGGMAAQAFAVTMSAPLPARPSTTTTTFTPPSRTRGTAARNVRDYGALGNGSADDTAAFQNAIDSLPSSGGTVFVPPGNYMIDAVRQVRLRSYMHLQMDPDAILIAKPNGSNQYAVVAATRIHDLEISGGQIIGERYQHTGTADGGGHCVALRGCERVTIRDIVVSKAWSAGVSVSCKPVYQAPLVMSRDVVLVGVVSRDNRRNALAITNCVGVRVYDSEFSGTNGTKPQVGIDIEPNEDIHGSNNYCDDVHIENCVISENARCGIVIWRRARNVTIKKCVIHRNASAGVFTDTASGVVLTENTVSYNGSNGIHILQGSRDFQVYGNTSYANYTSLGIKTRAPFDLVGLLPKVERDIRVGGETYNIDVGLNHYR